MVETVTVAVEQSRSAAAGLGETAQVDFAGAPVQLECYRLVEAAIGREGEL